MYTTDAGRQRRNLPHLISLALLAAAPVACVPADAPVETEAAGLPPSVYAPGPAEAASARQMAEAAQAFLAVLPEQQRAAAQFPFEADSVRTHWSNLPAMFVARSGARLGDLNDLQRRRLHDLLRASTSSQGYQKIAGVVHLDELLYNEASAAVAAGTRRLPDGLVESWTSANYWISFFGRPGADANWGWQLSGHHLAGNFTVVGDRLAFTPLFLGAEPNEIMEGLEAGWRVLAHESERGFELLQALEAGQRARAVVNAEVPRDVLEGPGRKGSLETFAGIPASALTDAQRVLLWALVEEYVANADHDAAGAQLARIQADGLDRLHFAWMGPTDDATKPYYYRVHGPSILIEYVVEQGVGTEAANHVHSIVRDPSNDYGGDWLGKHYEEHH